MCAFDGVVPHNRARVQATVEHMGEILVTAPVVCANKSLVEVSWHCTTHLVERDGYVPWKYSTLPLAGIGLRP